MTTNKNIKLSDYQALAEFRYQMRRYLHASEEAARAAGIEPQQHQILLAVKGIPDERSRASPIWPSACKSSTTARLNWWIAW